MEVRENAGYTITDSFHIGDAEFVLGQNHSDPAMFVTWKCANGVNYYWGHYFTERASAEKDLVVRAQEELRYREQRKGTEEQKTGVRAKECEREWI